MVNVDKSKQINTRQLLDVSQNLIGVKKNENASLYELAKELDTDQNGEFDADEVSLKNLLKLKTPELNKIIDVLFSKKDNVESTVTHEHYYVERDGEKVEITKDEYEKLLNWMESFQQEAQALSMGIEDSFKLSKKNLFPNITLTKTTNTELIPQPNEQSTVEQYPLGFKTLDDLKNDPILNNYFRPYIDFGEQTYSDEIESDRVHDLINVDMVYYTFNNIIEDKLNNGIKIIERSKDGNIVKFDDGSELEMDKFTKNTIERNEATKEAIYKIENLLYQGKKIKRVNLKRHLIVFDDGLKIKLNDSMDLYDIEYRAVCQMNKDKGNQLADSKYEEVENGIKVTETFSDGKTYTFLVQKHEDDIVDYYNLYYRAAAEDGSSSSAYMSADPNINEDDNKLNDVSIVYADKKANDFVNKERPHHYVYSNNIWSTTYGPVFRVEELSKKGEIVPDFDSESVRISYGGNKNLLGINNMWHTRMTVLRVEGKHCRGHVSETGGSSYHSKQELSD